MDFSTKDIAKILKSITGPLTVIGLSLLVCMLLFIIVIVNIKDTALLWFLSTSILIIILVIVLKLFHLLKNLPLNTINPRDIPQKCFSEYLKLLVPSNPLPKKIITPEIIEDKIKAILIMSENHNFLNDIVIQVTKDLGCDIKQVLSAIHRMENKGIISINYYKNGGSATNPVISLL